MLRPYATQPKGYGDNWCFCLDSYAKRGSLVGKRSFPTPPTGAYALVLPYEKARYKKPLMVSLSNHERLTLRQAQGERFIHALTFAT
jgi:hypothetical protein